MLAHRVQAQGLVPAVALHVEVETSVAFVVASLLMYRVPAPVDTVVGGSQSMREIAGQKMAVA